MPRILTNILRFGLTFAVLVLLFHLGMYLVCLPSSDGIYAHAKESYTTIKAQGGRPKLFAQLGIANDNYTDALIVNELSSVDSTEPFISYMKVRKNFRRGQTEVVLHDILGRAACAYYLEPSAFETFNDWYNDQEHLRGGQISELGLFLEGYIDISVEYGRYWHGYLVVFRPLFFFLNISVVRWLTLALFIALYALFLRLLDRRFGRTIAIIYGASLLFEGYFSVAFSLQGSLVFLVSIVSAILLLKRIDSICHIHLYFFVLGCLINYVDYLTVPLVSLGLLQALYLLKINDDNKSWQSGLFFLATSALAWLLGYAGTFLAKWVSYDIFINDGPGMVYTGLQQFFFRTSGEYVYYSPFDRSHLYLAVVFLGHATLFSLLTTGFILYRQRFALPALRGFSPRLLGFMCIAMYPLVWYQLLATHVTTHHYFAYRMALLYMLGFLLAWHELFYPTHLNNRMQIAPAQVASSSPSAPDEQLQQGDDSMNRI